MIQDILPRKFKNHFENKEIKEQDNVLIFDDVKMLAKGKGEKIDFYTYKECMVKEKRSYIYLFSIDEKNFFLYDNMGQNKEVSPLLIEKDKWMTMQQIRKCYPKEAIFTAVTGYHLYTWYKDNQYCGRCGSKTQRDTKERMLFCRCCENRIYPKIAPAVIVAVRNDNKILLTKYANRSYKRYALIAGFTEIGETVEETVKREVMEEVGLQVKNIQYYKSQPWGFDSNLLMGFFCDVDQEEQISLDREELSWGEWVEREQVPVYTEGLSLTHEMMLQFKENIW